MSSSRRTRIPTLVIGLAAITTLAGLAAVVTTEVVMVPTSTERTRLIALLAALAAVAVTIAVVLRLFSPRSFTRRILLAAITGPVLVAIAVSVGSQSMFLSEHDLQFLLILLAFATVVAIAVVNTLARPLTDDLAAITDVARRVGAGDLEARADLRRMDEIGELAAALDAMVEEIASTRQARDDAERERSITMASLSHDARTPLTSMRLATEALLDGVAPDPERYLRTIASDIDAVETLIADLFTIGQLEAGRLALASEPTDLGAVVDGVAQRCRLIAEPKSVDVQIHRPQTGPVVVADVAQIDRVLTNVVGNAVRYAPEGSTVRIVVDAEPPCVSVLDEGAGFPADFLTEAFQPFRRHDEARERAHGGAGLGLAVAKGIVDAHRGQIWADAGPGGAVHMRLPSAG